jgi:hypothetical protein
MRFRTVLDGCRTSLSTKHPRVGSKIGFHQGASRFSNSVASKMGTVYYICIISAYCTQRMETMEVNYAFLTSTKRRGGLPMHTPRFTYWNPVTTATTHSNATLSHHTCHHLDSSRSVVVAALAGERPLMAIHGETTESLLRSAQ